MYTFHHAHVMFEVLEQISSCNHSIAAAIWHGPNKMPASPLPSALGQPAPTSNKVLEDFEKSLHVLLPFDVHVEFHTHLWFKNCPCPQLPILAKNQSHNGLHGGCALQRPHWLHRHRNITCHSPKHFSLSGPLWVAKYGITLLWMCELIGVHVNTIS